MAYPPLLDPILSGVLRGGPLRLGHLFRLFGLGVPGAGPLDLRHPTGLDLHLLGAFAKAIVLNMLVTKPTKWLKHATSLPLRGVHPHGSRDLLVLDVGALAVGGIVAGVVGDLLIFIELILDGWCLHRGGFRVGFEYALV